MKKTIENREDISRLVHSFYGKIRKDDILGPIFNGHIVEDEWPIHLSKLTDFWETNLFNVPKFRGRPARKHMNVDANLGYTIEQGHFEHWLYLWFQTVDELYEGELANQAKTSAQKMAMGQFLAVLRNRPEHLRPA